MSQSSLADKVRAIKGSPQYIQEKYLHDRSCDGEGQIYQLVTTPYGMEEREVDCMFCKRIRIAKERKRDKEKMT